MENSTIAAISTALNEGGIGIIRISGPDAVKIADGIFINKKGEKNFSSFKSHTIHYGYIYDNDEMIDEVMISLFKAPNSFTKEDVVEINCHGGILICKKILDVVLNNGAVLAQPGEFTKRAFLNGRIDLSKAEAVMELISSKSTASMKNSLGILKGRLHDIIVDIRKRTIYEIAFIESALDDPEHISLDGYPDKLIGIVTELKAKADNLYESFHKGKFLKEGINTVIVGKPNVGKSSLLNVLTGYERAIVTDIAGTTRDTIEEHVVLNNVSLNLFDTAGIHETKDYVENIGVERAKKSADNADLILLLLDASENITDEDYELIEFVKGKNVIVLLNKSDKEIVVDREMVSKLFDGKCNVLEISAKEATGISKLEKLIEDMFFEGKLVGDDELYITSLRQADELKSVSESFQNVINSLEAGLPEDFYSIDLMSAYSSLGRIIGEDVDDDLVNEIFTKFCMGK